jgi:paraquat-inducible protein A
MTAGRRSIFLEMLMAGALFCLVLGLTLPVVRLTWLHFFSYKHSILSIIWVLFKDHEWLLSGVLIIFSALFPMTKLAYLLILYFRRLNNLLPSKRLLYILSWLGRWSMLDVLVLALIVFYTKQTGVADATVLPGIYLFAMSVLLTMWASELAEQQFNDLRKISNPDKKESPPLIEDQRSATGEQ